MMFFDRAVFGEISRMRLMQQCLVAYVLIAVLLILKNIQALLLDLLELVLHLYDYLLDLGVVGL